MKRKTLFLIIIILLIYGLGSIIYNYLVIDGVKTKLLEGEVIFDGTLIIAFNESEDWIHVGKMYPGYSNIYSLKESNNKKYKLKIELEVSGSIRNYIQIEPDSFVLEPGEEKIYKMTFQPSLSAQPGIYRGYLNIIEKRVLW